MARRKRPQSPIFAHGATLAEAAAAAGIDGRTLEKTVARYNELVKLGKDEDFSRPAAAFMKAAISSEGPYYIVEQNRDLPLRWEALSSTRIFRFLTNRANRFRSLCRR